jgi:hypothetical protein
VEDYTDVQTADLHGHVADQYTDESCIDCSEEAQFEFRRVYGRRLHAVNLVSRFAGSEYTNFSISAKQLAMWRKRPIGDICIFYDGPNYVGWALLDDCLRLAHTHRHGYGLLAEQHLCQSEDHLRRYMEWLRDSRPRQ